MAYARALATLIRSHAGKFELARKGAE